MTVTVVIPSFNRFKYLLKAIESVQNQTYKDIEIIIVNDCSTQDEYYTFDFKSLGSNIHVINLPKNSRQIFGKKVCGGGNARNIGMMLASGKYIAFLDDDDYFLPTKIEKQIKAMKKYNCLISCTEGYGGEGSYNFDKKYSPYHYNGINWETLKSIYRKSNKEDLLYSMYENEINIWGKEELNVHNCTIGGSSIVMDKELIDKAGYFPIKSYEEDYCYWKKLFEYSKCVFLRESLTYIDFNHGDGQKYYHANHKMLRKIRSFLKKILNLFKNILISTVVYIQIIMLYLAL